MESAISVRTDRPKARGIATIPGYPSLLVTPATLQYPSFSPPNVLVQAIGLGRPVIVCDNEDRENEGDLVFAAQFASPSLVNLMIRSCGGLICAALAPDLVARFGLAPMVPRNTCPRGTAFTASVDAAEGVGTGISARDRAAGRSVDAPRRPSGPWPCLSSRGSWAGACRAARPHRSRGHSYGGGRADSRSCYL